MKGNMDSINRNKNAKIGSSVIEIVCHIGLVRDMGSPFLAVCNIEIYIPNLGHPKGPIFGSYNYNRNYKLCQP